MWWLLSSGVHPCERKSIGAGRDRSLAPFKHSVIVFLQPFCMCLLIYCLCVVLFVVLWFSFCPRITTKRGCRANDVSNQQQLTLPAIGSCWISTQRITNILEISWAILQSTDWHHVAWRLQGSNGLEEKSLPWCLWFACEIDFIGFIWSGGTSVSLRSINKHVTRNWVDVMNHKSGKHWMNVSIFYITAVIL